MFTKREYSQDVLNTVEEIVDAVGGLSEAAALARVSGPAVSNWKNRGRIPADLWLVFSGACRRAGKEANPDVFTFAPTVTQAAP